MRITDIMHEPLFLGIKCLNEIFCDGAEENRKSVQKWTKCLKVGSWKGSTETHLICIMELHRHGFVQELVKKDE